MEPVVNVLAYKEDWKTRLQEELDEPVKWKDICNVEYTNTRVLHNPYLTDITVQTNVRGSPYQAQVVTETDDSITISQSRVAPVFIDRADLAQSSFMRLMDHATRQAVLLNEAVETYLFQQHSVWTDFDNASIGGAAGSITVAATNIDDIIRGLKREIREANGESLLNRNGGFVVWRPADLEILEAYMQANGFSTADNALRTGGTKGFGGFEYMGLTHYSSNLLAAGRIVAGVKKAIHLGLLRDTYGDVMIDEKDPGTTSGVSVVSRVDFAVATWIRMRPVVFDVAVA